MNLDWANLPPGEYKIEWFDTIDIVCLGEQICLEAVYASYKLLNKVKGWGDTYKVFNKDKISKLTLKDKLEFL